MSGSGTSRRGFLAGAGGLAAGAAAPPVLAAPKPAEAAPKGAAEPFFGAHQSGILTPQQSHCYVAAFDIVAADKAVVAAMMRRWTEASARLMAGLPAQPRETDPDAPAGDSGEGVELAPARLTLTFGFGPGLFVKDGKDRFGLADRRPEAFVDLPHFPGEQLVEQWTGGDLMIQACADDPMVPFHAVRQLSRLAYGTAELRWVQSGFLGHFGKDTPRNLMGFKDGSGNPSTADAGLMDQHVWAGGEAPAWMLGGTYAVYRRARMALEHWDRMKVSFQEQTFGRAKYSGAPLGGEREADEIDLDAADPDGNPVISDTAHIRLAAAANNGGARILRRSYSYNDGVNFVAERWPPWHQGMEYDAGLIFVCFQRDPRTGFVQINEKLSRFDMMNQFVTNVGGGLFACPRGVEKGGYIGRDLFE